jgi:protocatechuate 3,4-dioxygenase beta subunit
VHADRRRGRRAWHADAAGRYSDEASEGTSGQIARSTSDRYTSTLRADDRVYTGQHGASTTLETVKRGAPASTARARRWRR